MYITINQISFNYLLLNGNIFFKCEQFCPPQSRNFFGILMSEADGSGLCMPIIKYLLILGHVMRVSFLNVNHFAHLNREMVKEEFDVALKRDVIAIKSQRVPLHLVHVFSNVAPGNILKNTLRSLHILLGMSSEKKKNAHL